MKTGVVISDSHAGNIFGVTPPDYWLKTYQWFQEQFWNWYMYEVKQIGKVDFLVHNAETIDGPGGKDTMGLWTTDVDEQAECAAAVIDVWDAKKRYMTRGSKYHSAGVTKYDDMVANKVEAYIDDEIRLNVSGKRFQFRHVAPRSNTTYGQPSQVYKEVVRESVQALHDEYDAADVVVRSHNHYHFEVHSSKKIAYATPALELPRVKGVKRGSAYPIGLMTQYYDMGLTYIEVTDSGEVFFRPRFFPVKVLAPVEYITI